MIASLVIVLREVLEAALVIGIALAATAGLAGSRRAVLLGIFAGLLGALALAGLADQLSAALQGMGPELFNAGVLFAAVLMLAWHHIWMQQHGKELAHELKAVGGQVRAGARPLGALATVVALAVLREGAEVVLFLHGVAAGGGDGAPMLIGSALGLAGGVAIGTLLYLGLVRIPARQLFVVTGWLLLCLAAGMAAQASSFLIQAGWLPALIEPVWDTSRLLPGQSVPGLVLHALAGYDDRPSAMQLLFFAGTIAAVLLAARWVSRQRRTAVSPALSLALVAACSVGLLAAPRAEASHKVYSPIVEEGEVALELSGRHEADGDPGIDGSQALKLELEYAPTSFWLTEVAGEWERESGGRLEATEVAWENVFMLFEQGRHPVDVGLLVELAHSLEPGHADKLEVGALLQKDFGANLVRFNLVAGRELASGAETELEYALQYRWRRNERFEPGVEVYGGLGEFGSFGSLADHEHKAGPAVFGKFRLGRGAIRYEGAWLFGLTREAAAQTLRFLVEYEF